MSKPLVIDLCCGLGGWTRGFLAEGWDCIGFDIERHEYGDKRYPAELILQDIRQLCGYDLRAVNPALVVASPPCQNYSYMAMPWKRAKEQAAQIRADESGAALVELNALYDACFRIARQCGVPLVLENVRGAQPWVGRARAHFGSYYLWGDVESVGGRIVGARPQFGQSLQVPKGRMKCKVDCAARRFDERVATTPEEAHAMHFRLPGAAQKRDGRNFPAFENGLGSSPSFNGGEHEMRGVKTSGHVNQRDGFDHTRHLTNQRESDAVKGGGDWFSDPTNPFRCPDQGVKQAGLSGPAWFDIGAAARGSQTSARKAASAMIAEIPFDLASYIARVFKPS